MELNEKILELRKTHGMTQEELAQALFVTRQSVYKWETGRSIPDVGKVKQLCQLFQVSADELLELAKPSDAVDSSQSCQETDVALGEADIPARKATSKIQRLILAALLVLAILAAGFLTHRPSAEMREAVKLGIVSSSLQRHLGTSISEKDFLTMLQRISVLRGNTDSPALTKAVETATNEQLTREKAAYWLYCTHIWVTRDGTADLSIETHPDPDPITQRDVYQDLNTLSQKSVDALATPWERVLCRELDETAALFDIYDGTPQMDEEINAILYGSYYTSVTFCAAQKSFLSERTILENSGDSFRPKDKITGGEAIVAAYRLYGSW